MTATETIFTATADAQTSTTTRWAPRRERYQADAAHDLQLALLEALRVASTQSLVGVRTSLQEWTRDDATATLSVEARVILTSQDEEFDLSLIRDDDLLP